MNNKQMTSEDALCKAVTYLEIGILGLELRGIDVRKLRELQHHISDIHQELIGRPEIDLGEDGSWLGGEPDV